MAERNKNIAVFGIGPGSIDPLKRIPDARGFWKEGPLELRSIYTTPVGYEQLFKDYIPADCLSPMQSMRVVTSKGADFTVPTGDNKYFMVNYPAAVQHWQSLIAANKNHIELLPKGIKGKDIKVQEVDGLIRIEIDGGRYEFDAVVDATGINAVISSQVEPKRENEDFLVEYVCFGTYKGTMKDGEMMLIIGPAGGTSWMNKSIYQTDTGEPLVDIVFSGWGWKSHFPRLLADEGKQRLGILTKFVSQQPGISLESTTPLDLTYGMIRSQPIPNLQSTAVFPTGEAAGVAKPITGESFNRALYSGHLATDAIMKGQSPQEYQRQTRKRWSGDDYFLALGAERIVNQRRNHLGELLGKIDDWRRQGKFTDKQVKDMETLVINGRFPISLLTLALTDRVTLKRIFTSAANLTALKVFGFDRITDRSEWTFPPIHLGEQEF